jgi:hypothetical protein
VSLALEAVTDVGWTAGNGVLGVVAEQGDRVAVASSFPLLYWPGRAFYDGHRFHSRVVLYEKSTRRRLGVLDGIRWPIHEIAIHPQGTAVALATGSYDGGWLFDGELVVWWWKEGHVVRPVQGREIARVRWAADDHVRVLARPPDDEQGDDAFRTFHGGVLDAHWQSSGGSIRTEPSRPEDVGFDGAIAQSGPREWVDPPPRPKIWDVGLLEGGSVLAVGDDALAEIWDEKLARRRRLVVEGRGVQVLQVAGKTLVHAVRDDRSLLYAMRRGDLTLLREFDRVYLFSAGPEHLLGRDTSRDKPRRDAVFDARGEQVATADLGAFDVFNHALRLDGGALYFLRGTGDQPHQRKVLSRVKLGAGGLGTQDLQPWDGDVHRMGPTGCDAGGRLVFGFCDHHPQPGRGDSWIVGPGWKQKVSFPPVALAASGDVVVWALLNGEIGALHASTGAVIARTSAEADGVSTAATSLRMDKDRVVIGTLDGRIFRYRLVWDANGPARTV